jgi:hypothetical protein
MSARDKRRRPKSVARLYASTTKGPRSRGCIARQVRLGRKAGPCLCDWCLWRLRTLGG